MSGAHRWRQRLRDTGTLKDKDLGGGAVHSLLSWEEAEILDLIEQWGPVDRSHRKLAHRGSRLGVVFVSPSTVLRVALEHEVRLPGEPYRPRPQQPVLPEIAWERNRIWIWDASPFTRADQAHISDLKGDGPHLPTIRDPAVLDSELARVRREYNTVRLHAAIGYVTPDDEHHGRGPRIRRARPAGIRRARAERIKENRASKRWPRSLTPTAPVLFWG